MLSSIAKSRAKQTILVESSHCQKVLLRFSASHHVTPDRPQIRSSLAPRLSCIQLQIPMIWARTVTAEASIHAGDHSYPSHLLAKLQLAYRKFRALSLSVRTDGAWVALTLARSDEKSNIDDSK